MSELSLIVEAVQAIADNLSLTQQSASVWNRQLAQTTAYVIDRVGDTAGTDIKDCLIALRSAIDSVSKMQETLGVSIAAANAWVEKNSGTGTASPIAEHVMAFGSDYEPDEEEYSRGRRR